MRIAKHDMFHVIPAVAGNLSMRSAISSPIFWRIAGVVFVCIIAIEALLLTVSWFGERERQLSRIDESFALTKVVGGSAEIKPLLDALMQPKSSGYDGVPLLGYLIKHDGLIVARRGNTEKLDDSLAVAQNRLSSKNWIYDTRILAEQSATPVQQQLLPAQSAGRMQTQILLRLDVAEVGAKLKGYVFRITGMVLLISVFVTAGCLLLLTPLLVRPLQRLNLLIQAGQEVGLQNSSAELSDLNRTDEIGHVFRSFDSLRAQLAEAENENVRITKRFRHFSNLGADCFWEIDRDKKLNFVAGDIAEMFDLEPGQVIGKSVRRILRSLKSKLPDFYSVVPSLVQHGHWEGVLKKSSGETDDRTIRIVASPLYDEDNRFVGARGTVVDVTVASDLAKNLQYQATHDSLTGLFNRREFDRLLAEAISNWKDSRVPFCVCMIDLDRFKVINDNCGHAAGDLLLKQLAEQIRKSVRSGDVVARFGGDEFTILLYGCAIDSGVRIANAIREVVDRYRFNWKNKVFEVGASIGIADTDSSLGTVEEVLLAVDACCIKAKNLGRNQVQAYSPTDESVARQQGEMQWMARITEALQNNQLVLYYQPIVSVEDPVDTGSHFEILLRMRASDGTIYSPGMFLPAAERYSLIDKIDRQVADLAMSWISRQSIGPDTNLKVNINLSATTVSDDQFQRHLLKRINELGVNAKHFCFEITESAAMKNIFKTIEFLNSMRSMGCTIALDDFGSGFSSLSQLQTLPIDYIKIDGALIKDLPDSEINRALVKSVSEVAKILRVKTVAEFVENEEILRVLGELDIDYAQGYLFGKPMELVDLSLDGGLSDAA